jgi:hypothetical protein
MYSHRYNTPALASLAPSGRLIKNPVPEAAQVNDVVTAPTTRSSRPLKKKSGSGWHTRALETPPSSLAFAVSIVGDGIGGRPGQQDRIG